MPERKYDKTDPISPFNRAQNDLDDILIADANRQKNQKDEDFAEETLFEDDESEFGGDY